MTDQRRALPAVDTLLRHPNVQPLRATYAHDAVAGLARQILAAARDGIQDGRATPSLDELAERTVADANRRWRIGPRGVINATGVILHTNLGRAPLSHAAVEASTAAAGYSALEFDLHSGRRGSRHDHLASLLRQVTGAEDGIAVNNAASALVLALAALCRRREVIVSRGQAVEIGGGFRIPDIMREGGARLVEVGTTNKTRLADYADAITGRTAAILRVHASNFRIVGFTERVDLAPLANLARERGVVLIDDVGSGALIDPTPYGLAAEPLVQESVAAGADLVLFSGDKLLGGPQAGIIVGRADLVARLRKHPFARALRLDKATIAALSATLLHYVRGEATREIPVWRMIATPRDALVPRVQGWIAELPPADALGAVVVGGEGTDATVGGGSLPGETLPSYALSLSPSGSRRASAWASALAAALREGQTPVIARVEKDSVLLDARTVLPGQDDLLIAAVRQALEGTASRPSMSH